MIELFKQYQLNPSIELRNKIIEENLKLVYLEYSQRPDSNPSGIERA